jgi:hypothetical protein
LLKHLPDEDKLLATYEDDERWTLKELVAWLCPAADVTLEVQQESKKEIAVQARDWLTIPGDQLLKRLADPYNRLPPTRILKRAGRQLRILYDKDGSPVGRAAILIDPHEYEGIVTVDGFRHCNLFGIDGMLAGSATLAARTSAIPTVDADQVAAWATEQGKLAMRVGTKDDLATVAEVVLACRGDAQRLPIVRTKKGWLTESEWKKFAKDLDEVLMVDFNIYELSQILPHLKLHRNVALASEERPLVGGTNDTQPWLPGPQHPWKWWSRVFWSPQGRLIQALSQSWDIPIDDLLLEIEFFTPRKDAIEREIGKLNGKPFVTPVGVVTRKR